MTGVMTGVGLYIYTFRGQLTTASDLGLLM